MLFVDEEDMSHRYRKAYEREDALDAATTPAAAEGLMPDTSKGASGTFGESSRFFRAGEADGGGGASESFGSGGLAAAAGRGSPLGTAERRPEEKLFCDAFLDLQNLLVRPFGRDL